MRTIHKYRLTPGETAVSTFERARFLHVDNQVGDPVVWAEVNTLERECVRVIVTVPTGGEVPNGATYLGTFNVEGALWFHAYLTTQTTSDPTERVRGEGGGRRG